MQKQHVAYHWCWRKRLEKLRFHSPNQKRPRPRPHRPHFSMLPMGRQSHPKIIASLISTFHLWNKSHNSYLTKALATLRYAATQHGIRNIHGWQIKQSTIIEKFKIWRIPIGVYARSPWYDLHIDLKCISISPHYFNVHRGLMSVSQGKRDWPFAESQMKIQERLYSQNQKLLPVKDSIIWFGKLSQLWE